LSHFSGEIILVSAIRSEVANKPWLVQILMCHGSKVLFQIRQGKYIEIEVYEEMEALGIQTYS
jgi:hypothetical protein